MSLVYDCFAVFPTLDRWGLRLAVRNAHYKKNGRPEGRPQYSTVLLLF